MVDSAAGLLGTRSAEYAGGAHDIASASCSGGESGGRWSSSIAEAKAQCTMERKRHFKLFNFTISYTGTTIELADKSATMKQGVRDCK